LAASVRQPIAFGGPAADPRRERLATLAALGFFLFFLCFPGGHVGGHVANPLTILASS
jgi:hypothetical protein